MHLTINGELKELAAPLSLQELIEMLTLASERVAVELNGLVVPRTAWSSTLLTNNDRIEIVHFVGGGSDELAIHETTRRPVTQFRNSSEADQVSSTRGVALILARLFKAGRPINVPRRVATLGSRRIQSSPRDELAIGSPGVETPG